ncbi:MULTISPECIES: nuclear transport factor 2 family protein [unclassified Nocardioides]|uniref:nuclear transport factor 2 family protein n=1 Tax=unclassified Nocardioides TaxID=2615069 RepID=UPI00360F0DEA
MNSHPLATTLAHAIAERAPERLGAQLSDTVRLRALLPGGELERTGREAVVAQFADWFGDFGTVVLDDVAGDTVGDRVLVHYKLLVDRRGDRRVVTQTVVCGVADGQVRRMDLVCSGFRELS